MDYTTPGGKMVLPRQRTRMDPLGIINSLGLEMPEILLVEKDGIPELLGKTSLPVLE
jgi:hypothetical protein